MSKSVLVVGAKGFIGAAVTRELIDLGFTVAILEPNISHLGRLMDLGAIDVYEGSVADGGRVRQITRQLQPAAIVNLAYTRNTSIAHEMDVMCRGLWNTLDAALHVGCARVVLTSSVRVYGPQVLHGTETMLNEGSVCRPIVRYGFYKLLGERLCSDYRDQHALVASALRIPAVYGPGIREGAFGVAIPALAAATGQATQLPYDPDARQCLAYVDDVAAALVRLLNPEEAEPRHAVYELGGNITSYREMAEIASSLVEDTEISFIDDPRGAHPEKEVAYQLDNSRIADEFGLLHRSVEDGYRAIVDAHRQVREGE